MSWKIESRTVNIGVYYMIYQAFKNILYLASIKTVEIK